MPEPATPPSPNSRRAAVSSTRQSRRRRFLRWAGLSVLVAAGGLLLASAAVVWHLRSSLPQLAGERQLPGLTAAVTVERDAAGVPTIRAASRLDAARGLGFLHAQERFFQMDLLRRRSAGELAALVGGAAVRIDRATRVHRFRDRAEHAVSGLPAGDRSLLEAYTAGVNAGLAALGAVPVEYLALRTAPEPWQLADSMLAVYAMFLDLQDDTGRHESARGLLHDTLPPPVAAFLLPAGSPLDAPLEGPPLEAPPLPAADVVDLRRETKLFVVGERPAAELSPWERLLAPPDEPEVVLGSNNWAVAGSHTADGHPLLAGDMHLRLGVPSIWYRAAIVWPGDTGERRVVGVTLPGTPSIVAGSTGSIAWAFTNTEGDWMDLVIIESDPRDPSRYRTPDGWQAFTRHREMIEVAGAADETLEVTETIWGPVIDRDHRGRLRALRWTAHDHDAVNLGLMRLEEAGDVEAAVRLAADAGVPAQNLVCVDTTGRIAWTIIGRMPRRVGCDGRLPSSWADGAAGWQGWLAEEDRPRLIDPACGRLWSANARVAAAHQQPLIGDEGQDVGGRQGQIRDALLAIDAATARDMLDLQLDDRAVFLERWRTLLVELLTPDAIADDPRRQEARRLVEAWGGRASVDSAGYRIVREWRLAVAKVAFEPFVAAARDADPRFDYIRDVRRFEGPLWTLVTKRPTHLVDPRFGDWATLLLATLDDTLASLAKEGPLPRRTWGEWNVSRVQHPLGAAIPLLSWWLDMPARSLPGDANMPRVQLPWAGASQRMVVTPGREEEGFFHMPGGQSGHPLSPHYRDGHPAWAAGEPTPFLPGPTVHTLTLVP